METSFIVYNDPGHGWVAAKRTTLIALGIQDKVTPYSYQRGDTVYLEEDCDASILIRALESLGIKPKFKEYHANRESRIRGYDRYVPQ